jgi:alkaline phosphatase D
MTRASRAAVAASLASLLAAAVGGSVHASSERAETSPRPDLPQGVAVAEVTAEAGVLWARCPDGDRLRVSVDRGDDREVRVDAARDFTARLDLDHLTSGAEHTYRARCVRGAGAGEAIAGRFRTAPVPSSPAPVRFAFGGDVGGQNVCRDAMLGYPIFAAIAATRPDFFIALGDLIYADNRCLEIGALRNRQIPGPPVAREKADFWAHWRYNRSDGGQRDLLASVSYYPVWDDHEVRNDFAPPHDRSKGGPGSPARLVNAGLAAFLDYNPIRPPASAPGELYRSFRWGRHLEIFILDTRLHRDANAAPDLASHPKTLLGNEQRDWLLRSLASSDATWKVVVSSVPLSIPTGTDARDGWADGGGPQGFERELRSILEQLRRDRVRGIVFLTTDVHFATAFQYRPFPDDPEFELHELVTGPLHAGLVPLQALDPTFSPTRLFFYGPAAAHMPATLTEALPWFNFGLLEVSAKGELTARVVDANGETRATIRLSPAARG